MGAHINPGGRQRSLGLSGPDFVFEISDRVERLPTNRSKPAPLSKSALPATVDSPKLSEVAEAWLLERRTRGRLRIRIAKYGKPTAAPNLDW